MSASARAVLRSVFGSTARAVGELNAADQIVRTPLPLSRRVGFVALDGGSGTTAAVGSVASLLARRRSGMVLAADTSGGRSGLRPQLMADPSVQSGESAEDRLRRRFARSAADARQGLDRTESGLYLLDLAGPDRRPVPVAGWADELGPVVRFFDLVLTDWGVRPAGMDLDAVAATGHLLVVVSRAERRAATAAADAIEALRRIDGAPRFVLALADLGRSSDRIAGRLRGGLGVPVVELPFERARVVSDGSGSRDFGAATRTAHIRLATAVLNEVVETASAGGRMPLRVEPAPVTRAVSRV